MLERPRPLSPFLHYRWQYTNTLSILHRATGVILAGGFLLLVYWLAAIARGPAAYAHTARLLSYPPFGVLLAFAGLAFAYHLCNGIRHLLWDCGFGLERREARRSAWGILVVTALIAVLVGCALFLRLGGVS
jgi:succinate dehydrogenase / fumarate reductase cytochrome b subunit